MLGLLSGDNGPSPAGPCLGPRRALWELFQAVDEADENGHILTKGDTLKMPLFLVENNKRSVTSTPPSGNQSLPSVGDQGFLTVHTLSLSHTLMHLHKKESGSMPA